MIYNNTQNVFREEAAPRRAGKKQQSIGIRCSYSNASWFWIKKNCISKLSIKMFIKRKTRAGKAYVYGMFTECLPNVYRMFTECFPNACEF